MCVKRSICRNMYIIMSKALTRVCNVHELQFGIRILSAE